jgi:hypothetical protein
MASEFDDFNRADSGTLGANWTNTANGMVIFSNQAAASVNLTENLTYRSNVAFSGDHYSEATFTGSGHSQLTVRHQAGGDLYLLSIHATNGSIRIYKYISGGYTELANLSTTPTSGHVYKFQAVGTTLSAYDNGVQMGSNLTDATLSGGAPGLGSELVGDRWDDWTGADVGGGGGGDTNARLIGGDLINAPLWRGRLVL